jgi:hypothetical protein
MNTFGVLTVIVLVVWIARIVEAEARRIRKAGTELERRRNARTYART